MHFTQEDYKKIENWLHRNSVKDTEFQEALPFTGKEIVTVVQDGHNRKVNIQEFINQLYKHGVEDFLNVTNTYKANNITLKEAIKLIPAEARKEGQVITFLNTDGNWEIYQFIGKLNQWNNPTLWNNPFDWEKLIVDSILPDEEDLTKSAPDAKGNSYLSLKDRKYEPDKYSGLGRKILRRRVVEIEDPVYGTQEKNLLLQADFAEDNTVYVVRYDFTLNGQDITLPDNSYIEYEGGSISDGNIIDRAGGLNRVVIKKNIVNGKNILTQDMINKSNTIYEIIYDFDLNNTEITIPESCVLDFKGGSLNNGTIIFSNTVIEYNNRKIFGLSLNVSGNLKQKMCLEWFGYESKPDNDAAPYFLKILNSGFYIQLLESTYYVNSQVELPSRWCHIYGMGRYSIIKINYNGFAFVYNSKAGENNGVELYVQDLSVSGTFPSVWAEDNQAETLTSFFKNDEESYIYFAKIVNVYFSSLNEALHLERGYCTRVNKCHFIYCKNSIHVTDANSSSFTDNQFRWIKEHSLWISDSKHASLGTNGINISGNDFSSNSASVIFIDGTVSSMSFTGNYVEPAIEQYIPNSITYGIQVGVPDNNYGEAGVPVPTLGGSLIWGNTGWAEHKNSKRIIKVYGNYQGNLVNTSADLSEAKSCRYNIGNNEYEDAKTKEGYSFLNIYDKSYIKGSPITDITSRTIQLNNVALESGKEEDVTSLQCRYLRIHNFDILGYWKNVQLIVYNESGEQLSTIPITEDSIKGDIVLPRVGYVFLKIKNNGGSPVLGDFIINYTMSNYTKFM